MDDELGPAKGEFRVWLDLALARGYRVTWTKGVHIDASNFSDDYPPEGDPIYTVQDTTTGRQDAVWSVKGVRAFFDYLDTYVNGARNRQLQDINYGN